MNQEELKKNYKDIIDYLQKKSEELNFCYNCFVEVNDVLRPNVISELKSDIIRDVNCIGDKQATFYGIGQVLIETGNRMHEIAEIKKVDEEDYISELTILTDKINDLLKSVSDTTLEMNNDGNLRIESLYEKSNIPPATDDIEDFHCPSVRN